MFAGCIKLVFRRQSLMMMIFGRNQAEAILQT